jgi:hypothetical protein
VLFQLLIPELPFQDLFILFDSLPKIPQYPILNTHSYISTYTFTIYRTQSNFTRPASIAGDVLAFTSQYRTRPPACDKVRLLTIRPPTTYHLRLTPVSSPPGLQPTGANSNTSQHFYLKSTSNLLFATYHLFILFKLFHSTFTRFPCLPPVFNKESLAFVHSSIFDFATGYLKA